MISNKLWIRACELRRKGYSYRQISVELGISKNTAYLWTNQIRLDADALKRLKNVSIEAKKRSDETSRQRQQASLLSIHSSQEEYLSGLIKQGAISNYYRLLCAMIYWCEGAKNANSLIFTNSDPNLIKYFLYLLRNSFKLDESKFRIVMHLHGYHDVNKQRSFWSEVSLIPVTQFTKPYLKSNMGKIKRQNYPGCIALKYYDASIARQLLELAKVTMNRYNSAMGA